MIRMSLINFNLSFKRILGKVLKKYFEDLIYLKEQ